MAKKPKAPKHTDSTGSAAADSGVDTSNFDANDRAMASLYGNKGVATGKALASKFYSNGSLGSVSTEVGGAQGILNNYKSLQEKYANPSAEQTDTLGRMKAGLGGYSSQEYQASREQMQRGLNSNMQTTLGQLAKAQARGKVYGAAGVAQQQNAMRAGQMNKDNLEQDLMVKNIDEQQRRLQAYGQYGSDVHGQNFQQQQGLSADQATAQQNINTQQLDREKINMANRQAETAGQIGAYTGSGALALTEEQAKAMNTINKKGLSAIK